MHCVIDADRELIDRIAQNDMVRGITIAAGGFFGPQGRELRIPLADPEQNEKIEKFEYKDYRITTQASSVYRIAITLMVSQDWNTLLGRRAP